ncbi:MAG: hypothetical protein J7L26_10145 [Candidatus Aminicenantes bacterium]|nr:hypothetical protein [Candidatus Aminicenantes bacterium]
MESIERHAERKDAGQPLSLLHKLGGCPIYKVDLLLSPSGLIYAQRPP